MAALPHTDSTGAPVPSHPLQCLRSDPMPASLLYHMLPIEAACFPKVSQSPIRSSGPPLLNICDIYVVLSWMSSHADLQLGESLSFSTRTHTAGTCRHACGILNRTVPGCHYPIHISWPKHAPMLVKPSNHQNCFVPVLAKFAQLPLHPAWTTLRRCKRWPR